MVLLLINKILYVIFFLSCLVLIRHGFLFYRNYSNDEPKKYTVSVRQLLYISLSVAIILMSVFKGIGL